VGLLLAKRIEAGNPVTTRIVDGVGAAAVSWSAMTVVHGPAVADDHDPCGPVKDKVRHHQQLGPGEVTAEGRGDGNIDGNPRRPAQPRLNASERAVRANVAFGGIHCSMKARDADTVWMSNSFGPRRRSAGATSYGVAQAAGSHASNARGRSPARARRP
jgi:hypothetical protein